MTAPYCLSLQVSNKIAIIQDFMQHDAILKQKGVLHQLSSGLSILGLLDVIKCFPVVFEPLCTYQNTEMLSAEKMMQMFPVSA